MDQDEERHEAVQKAKWAAATGALVRHIAAPSDHGPHPEEERLPFLSFSNGVADQPPMVREAARMLMLQLNHAELSRFAGVELSDGALLELATATAAYAGRFHASYENEGYLSDEEWQNFLHNPLGVEVAVRRAYLSEILAIWERAGGTGNNSKRRTIRDKGDTAQIPDGPVVKLAVALLRSLPNPDGIEAFTIHHDVNFLTTGRERHRAKRA